MNLNLSLVAQAITFAAFIWFTVKFVWPPLLRMVEARQKTIADGLAAAEQGRRSLELSTRQADDAIKEACDLSSFDAAFPQSLRNLTDATSNFLSNRLAGSVRPQLLRFPKDIAQSLYVSGFREIVEVDFVRLRWGGRECR